MEENVKKKKKSILKRWWFWLIAVVVIIGIVGSIGGTEEDAKQTGSPGATTAADPTPEEKVYKIGDSVEVGKFSITISSCTEQDKFKSDNMYIDDVTTEGKFIAVEAKIVNNDKEARTIDTNMFKLVDSQNREFEVYSKFELMTMLGDKYLFLESVNPGMSRSGIFVFEVPKDVNEYSLKMYPGILFKTGKPETVKLK